MTTRQTHANPTDERVTRAGRVSAVSYASGLPRVSVEIEAQGDSVPNVPCLGHYLAPKVNDSVMISGRDDDPPSWVCLGAISQAGPPLTKIGSRLVTQVVPNSTNTVGAFSAANVGVDSHGWADAANNRIVPTIRGWYLVAGFCTGEAVGDQTRFIVNVRVGGARVAGTDMVTGGSATPDVSASEVVYLDGTAADAVDVNIFQASGGSLTCFWSLSVTLMRPGLS